ncbi:MAG TPA: NYN domain-containing protein, partial [Thermoanaerobaculia bacterium]|nr:NYN domain-containing protein [Thermoanaerobaculia bacterium]
ISGDGDFVKVVEALQNRGLRLEAIGFDNVSKELQTQADLYLSGYLIPGLLPGTPADGDERRAWGEEGSRVRGTCHWFDHAKGYGFLRFLSEINDRLWTLDSRDPESPYRTAFLHASTLEREGLEQRLPNRELVFEFTLKTGEKGFVAEDVALVNEF